MHKARKRFGQNFLIDVEVIDRIVSAISPLAEDAIVEIGPGQGALTRHLLASGADLRVIEIDRDLAADLPRRVPGLARERILVGDALKIAVADLVGDGGIRIVGNLPYNISTPLLVHLFESLGVIRDMHFMLQREIVARMAAEPGGKEFGRLSLLCQYHCSIAPLFDVPPAAFQPVPRVHSTVVRMQPHAEPPVRISDREVFDRLVTAAFAQRRKTLRNSLKTVVDAEHFEAAGIDPGLRAEALGLKEYAALAEVVAN